MRGPAMIASAFFRESHSFVLRCFWFAIIRLRCIRPNAKIRLWRVYFQRRRNAASCPADVMVAL